jgi:hypothetical protein
MLAMANDIEIADYQDMLHHLIDKTGVNLIAEKVLPCQSRMITQYHAYVWLCRIVAQH